MKSEMKNVVTNRAILLSSGDTLYVMHEDLKGQHVVRRLGVDKRGTLQLLPREARVCLNAVLNLAAAGDGVVEAGLRRAVERGVFEFIDPEEPF